MHVRYDIMHNFCIWSSTCQTQMQIIRQKLRLEITMDIQWFKRSIKMTDGWRYKWFYVVKMWMWNLLKQNFWYELWMLETVIGMCMIRMIGAPEMVYLVGSNSPFVNAVLYQYQIMKLQKFTYPPNVWKMTILFYCCFLPSKTIMLEPWRDSHSRGAF